MLPPAYRTMMPVAPAYPRVTSQPALEGVVDVGGAVVGDAPRLSGLVPVARAELELELGVGPVAEIVDGEGRYPEGGPGSYEYEFLEA
jgi:hypothetical protein